MTAKELDEILTVARKHKATALVMGDLQVKLDYTEDFEAQPSAAVINGGWKRSPNLSE